MEAPVKFLYTSPPSDIPRSYPFSVLGLGDGKHNPLQILFIHYHGCMSWRSLLDIFLWCTVVIPGLFVRLMSKADTILQPKNLSYFNVATCAYAVGLMACFGANEIYHNGQPALLYLDPSLIGSTLACAAVNNQVPLLWQGRSGWVSLIWGTIIWIGKNLSNQRMLIDWKLTHIFSPTNFQVPTTNPHPVRASIAIIHSLSLFDFN